MEQWEPIPNFEGKYLISNLGNVKSLERLRKFGSQIRTIEERILKPANFPNGYLFATLSDYPQVKKIMIHRLVAQAFIPNPENKPHINHINGNKKDNNYTNLEWVTRSENMQHYVNNLMDYDIRNCKQCSKEYKPRAAHQTFCSNSCKSNYRRKAGIDDVIRYCAKCHKRFKAWKYGDRKFCKVHYRQRKNNNSHIL